MVRCKNGAAREFRSAAACRCVDPHAPCPVARDGSRHHSRTAASQSEQSRTSDVHVFGANANAVAKPGHMRDGGRAHDIGQGVFVYMVMAAVCFIFYWAYRQELPDPDSDGASRIIAVGNDDDDDHTSGV